MSGGTSPTYRLSYRDLVAMMAERGVAVTHTTIMRWVLRYVPECEKRWARFARLVGSSWRMDETSVSIRGRAHYLYRAVDWEGKSVDSLLCSERTMEAAQASLRRAVTTQGAGWPRTINLDGYTASHRAVRLLGQEDPRWRSAVVRNCRYLYNIVEQDHQAIKRRCASMLGFKSSRTAALTLSGIELAHRIRKRQFRLDLGEQGRPAADRCGIGPSSPLSLCRQVVQVTSLRKCTRTRERAGIRFRSFGATRHGVIHGRLFQVVAFTCTSPPSGGKYWHYMYRYRGKEKTHSLGAYPDVRSDSYRARSGYRKGESRH